VTVGQTATFTAAATGSPTPTVQWQVSTDNGVTFGNVSGATSTTLSFTSASSQNGYQYRAVFMNSAGTAMTRAATLTVNSPAPPTITTQPGNQTVTAGQTATFMAVATGSPTPTVQWQVSTDSGVTFGNVSGATSTTLSFTSASSQNGYQYRAVFTNATGTATTTAATLTVNAAPPASGTVTLQNTNSNLCIDTGGSTSFTYLIQSACSTSNTQKFTLTAAPVSGWYYLVSAASNLCWDVAGGSSSAGALIQQYSCVAVPPEYYQLKAITGGYEILSRNMTNGCLDVVGGSTASGAHIEQNTCTGSANQIFKTTSSALSPPTITTQPGNQTVTAGQTATFTAAATGSPTPTVQWQVSTDSGATFGNVSGATSTTLSFAVASSQNTNQYRAIFTNSAGTATTTAAALTVNSPTQPTITTQPANQTVTAGQTATFTAAATGSPTPTVQWQVSTDSGVTFGNVSGATSTTLSFAAASSQNGNQYRAVFTNSVGPATTAAATLTVNTLPAITTQPANQAVTVGQTATFTAAATGSPTPTVQWQVSTDNGVTFGNVSGATSTTLSFTSASSQNGYQYRAVFMNSAGTAMTRAATLTVNSPAPPTITTQPGNQTVTAGQTATFMAVATGSPTPTVQWQVSTDSGVTFGNVSGATSTTLSFTSASSQNGYQYRAVFTNATGTATTTAATLTVNAAPPASGTVTLQNTNSNLCIDTGGSTSFTYLIQSACSTSNTQKFTLTAAPVSGWYYLVSAASNLCWDVAGGSSSAGALIQQYSCVAVPPEYYQLKAITGGYEILSRNMTNGCLDVVGGSTASGAHIEQNTCTGSANQIFKTTSSALSPPTITTQPGNQTVTAGQTATFTAAATGSPTPTVQWQVSTDSGATFGNVSGATSTTLSFAVASSQNTNQYRAIFTNSAGTATTTAAALTVNAAPPPSGAGTAQLITPAAGASGVDPFQAFTWNSVPGAQVYYIYVGTSPGQTDIYNSSEIAPTITSRTVLGLIGGQTYYVTLWTKINNTWNSAPSSFTTASQPLPSDANTFRSTVQQLTGNVRLMTQGTTNSPIPGTLLAQVVAEDGVQWAFCTQYAETLTRLFMGQRISTRIRSIVFDGTSSESHVTSEYYDPFLNKWIVADPTFGVVYWNPGIASGLSIDEISSAVAAQNWSYIQPFITYITNNGALYAHNYYMDPILLYLNPLPTGVLAVQLPLANSPQPFFTVHATTDIGTSGTWVFGFVNQTDRVTLSGGSQYGPIGGTIYSQSLTLNIGWSITSGPSGMQILTMNRYLYL